MADDGGRRDIDVDGRRLSWTSTGSGPTLVLVNGYSATAADWDPGMVAELARSFTVVCPDNRGVGRSELGDPAEVSVAGMAVDVTGVLDALDVDRAALVGWSMGGFIAQHLATVAPARVGAAVLLATDAGGPSAVLTDDRYWGLLTDCSGTPRQQASRIVSVLFPPAFVPEIDRLFGDLVATARAQLSPEALAAQEQAIVAWHAVDQPPAGPDAPPVLVAHGTEDVVIPAANAAVVAAHWPGARLELFEGAGHAFMALDPTRVAALISSFVGG